MQAGTYATHLILDAACPVASRDVAANVMQQITQTHTDMVNRATLQT